MLIHIEEAAVSRLSCGLFALRSSLFTRHTLGEDFALYNFVRWFALHHTLAGKCLTAFRTGAVAGRVVFCDAFDKALYQTSSSALSIFVQQRFTR